jgi:YidC/Oxa1 family membrane protein insertase
VIDNRNLILAIVFSLAILLGFEFLVNAPQRERLAEQQRQEQALTPDVEAPVPEIGEAPASPGTLPEAPAAMTRAQALEESPRLAIDTPSLRGSIALEGARIDDLILKKYRETIEDGSPEIVLLRRREYLLRDLRLGLRRPRARAAKRRNPVAGRRQNADAGAPGYLELDQWPGHPLRAGSIGQ